MEDFANEILNGRTFEIAINGALKTVYKVDGKKCTPAQFWQARKAAESAA